MCNEVHPDATPILTEGFGWKFFSKKAKDVYWPSSDPDENRLYQCVGCFERYATDGPFSCKWNGLSELSVKEEDVEYGFCFFPQRPTEKEIEIIKEAFHSTNSDIVLRRIFYTQGLGQHKETAFVSGREFTIGICKHFKLVRKGLEAGEHL